MPEVVLCGRERDVLYQYDYLLCQFVLSIMASGDEGSDFGFITGITSYLLTVPTGGTSSPHSTYYKHRHSLLPLPLLRLRHLLLSTNVRVHRASALHQVSVPCARLYTSTTSSPPRVSLLLPASASSLADEASQGALIFADVESPLSARSLCQS